MFNKNNISASFFPNTTSSRSFGYGSIDFAGVSVNYSVMPSQYGLGIFVMYPSRPKMKDGVHEKDQNGGQLILMKCLLKIYILELL